MQEKEEDKRKQYKKFKITLPMSSPEEKGKTMPGTSFVVMTPVTTDNVMNLDVLETKKIYLHTKTRLSLCLYQVHQST
jgi:hypothetical protein